MEPGLRPGTDDKEHDVPSPTAQQSEFQLAVLRLISGGLAIGFAVASIWGEFEPTWMRPVAIAAAVICVLFTAALTWFHGRNDLVVRAFLSVIMALVFFVGLAIQPVPLGTLSGFVFLGIAVGIASYEKLGAAIVMSLVSVGFGIVAIAFRSSVPAPALGVFVTVAAASLFAVFGFRRVATSATQEAIADSLKDPLTGITNRRGLALGASLLSALADRSGQRLGCLILDLDHFKSVNDNHGHEAGDRVLIAVARRVQEVARQGDLFVRMGGEEFAVFTVVRNAKDLTLVAERLRAAVEDLAVEPRITTSVGGALQAQGAELHLEEFMSRADRQLYEAKAAGRNAIRVASD